MEIHQFIESFSNADAIGYHALGIQNFLQEQGIKSSIYANHFDEKTEKKCYHYSKFPNTEHSKSTKILYHHSIYSEAYEYLKELPYQKLLFFHNITPPEFFDDKLEFKQLLEKGYQQLSEFNQIFEFSFAASTYNKKVLREYNYKQKVHVIPPFVNLKEKFGPYMQKRESASTTKIIFVSKIAPHKKQTDLIKVFQIYQNFFNPKAKLYIIGSYNPDDLYFQKVNKLAEKKPDVILTGRISLKKLVYHYQTADLFLCLSEHEGFGIPIIEAMFFNLPIIAYKATAVPDTLGKGGILVDTKDPLLISATINKLSEDDNLRNHLLKSQKKELSKYRPSNIESKLKKWLIKN